MRLLLIAVYKYPYLLTYLFVQNKTDILKWRYW